MIKYDTNRWMWEIIRWKRILAFRHWSSDRMSFNTFLPYPSSFNYLLPSWTHVICATSFYVWWAQQWLFPIYHRLSRCARGKCRSFAEGVQSFERDSKQMNWYTTVVIQAQRTRWYGTHRYVWNHYNVTYETWGGWWIVRMAVDYACVIHEQKQN